MIVVNLVKRCGSATDEHRDLKTFSRWPVGLMDILNAYGVGWLA